MVPNRILLSNDATASYLATEHSSHLLTTRNSRKSFISLHCGSKSSEVTYFTVTGTVIYPVVHKRKNVGGDALSGALYHLLKQTFGEKMLSSYRDENYEGYTDLLCAVEKSKHLFQKNHDMVLHVPFSFSQHFSRKTKTKILEHPNRMGFLYHPTDNTVIIPHDVIAPMFTNLADQLADLIKDALNEVPPVLNVSMVPIYLTGGLGRNGFLQCLLRAKLGSFKVILASKPTLALLYGALCSVPLTSAKTRQSALMLGMTAAAHYDRETLHPQAVTFKDHAVFCNAFIPFVMKNEYLTSADHEAHHSFFAASPQQESILIKIFFSERDQEPLYEDRMECVSQLQLYIPLEKRGVATGRLFVFEVILKFEEQPEGILVTVKDSDGVVYGTSRILRPVVRP